MGLMSFIKDAGEKLFGRGNAKAAQDKAATAPAPENQAEAGREAGAAIIAYIEAQALPVGGLNLSFDPASATVTVAGSVDSQAIKEKVLLCCGNVAGVAAVNDLLVVVTPEPESVIYVVVRGDTLSAISKRHYGNANKYMLIFEANKPMLSHPDKIYPGQALRIPPLP